MKNAACQVREIFRWEKGVLSKDSQCWVTEAGLSQRLLQVNEMAAQALDECCYSNTVVISQFSNDRDPAAGTATSSNILQTTTVTQLQPQQKQQQAYITPTIKFTFQAQIQCQHIQRKSRENSLCCPNSVLVPCTLLYLYSNGFWARVKIIYIYNGLFPQAHSQWKQAANFRINASLEKAALFEVVFTVKAWQSQKTAKLWFPYIYILCNISCVDQEWILCIPEASKNDCWRVKLLWVIAEDGGGGVT